MIKLKAGSYTGEKAVNLYHQIIEHKDEFMLLHADLDRGEIRLSCPEWNAIVLILCEPSGQLKKVIVH